MNPFIIELVRLIATCLYTVNAHDPTDHTAIQTPYVEKAWAEEPSRQRQGSLARTQIRLPHETVETVQVDLSITINQSPVKNRRGAVF